MQMAGLEPESAKENMERNPTDPQLFESRRDSSAMDARYPSFDNDSAIPYESMLGLFMKLQDNGITIASCHSDRSLKSAYVEHR